MPKSVATSEYQRLLRELRKIRKNAGVTQVQLSKTLGKPQSFVSKIESGERRIDFIELLQILGAIGVEPRKFLTGFISQSRIF